MEHSVPTTWLLKLPFLPQDPHYLPMNGAIIVFLVISLFAFFAYRAIQKRREEMIVPDSSLNAGSFADLLVESLHNLVVGILGHHGMQHFGFIAACFIFIWFSNLLGLLPLSDSPSANINTTAALGILSFLYYNYAGVRAHGAMGYMKHFLMGLPIYMGLPIALIEMISHAVRPASLSFRLYINMYVDHTLVGGFQQICAWLVPVPLLLFGLVICTIQAFLFAVLSAVYIQMASEHE